MTHRFGRSRRSAVSLFAQVLASHAYVFTASSYIVDGGTGDVRSWVDHKNASHVLDQASAALQVPVPAGHADFSGGLCATFEVNAWYRSNQTAESWAFLTGGAGTEVAAAVSLTSVAINQEVIATGATGSQAGLVWFIGSTTPALGLRKTSGTNIIQSNPGTVATGPQIFQQRHGTAQDPDHTAKKSGSAAVAADYASAADAVTPLAALTLGASGAGTFLSSMRWHSLPIATHVLSAAERDVRDAWFLAETGLAA